MGKYERPLPNGYKITLFPDGDGGTLGNLTPEGFGHSTAHYWEKADIDKFAEAMNAQTKAVEELTAALENTKQVIRDWAQTAQHFAGSTCPLGDLVKDIAIIDEVLATYGVKENNESKNNV